MEGQGQFMYKIRSDAGLLLGATVAVAAALPVQAADNYAFGVCTTALPSAGAQIRPISAAGSYLHHYRKDDPRYKNFSFGSDAKITLIKAPKYGKLVIEDGPWSSKSDYHYWQNKGYSGRDRFVMQVEKDGIKIRVNFLVEAVDDGTPLTYIGEDRERHYIYCNPETWKINTIMPYSTNLAALLAGADKQLSFADLPDASPGQTTGTTPRRHLRSRPA